MEDYRRLAWKLAPAPGITPREVSPGSMIARKRLHCESRCDGSATAGYAVEMLTVATVLEDLEPGSAFADPGAPVAWFPDEAWVDPRTLTQRLVEGVRNAGGRVLMGPEREVVAIGIEAVASPR